MRADPYRLSATEAAAEISAGNLSVEALIVCCLDRIKRWDSKIKAWVSLDPHYALDQARTMDKRLVEGEPIGKLAGIPVGVKDVFNTAVLPTQMGSASWEGFKAGNDARVVAVLRLEGAVILGKTVTAEFAVHSPGDTRNPHNFDHTPGTSSSGSVAAVASGMVPVALCTQTAGSTIRPASYCGVYGMKPSFGLIPRTGMLKTTDTLDHVGFCTRTVDDLALMLDVLRVRGADYPIVTEKLHEDAPCRRPWRVALVRGPFWSQTEEYARAALETFAAAIDGQDVHVTQTELPVALVDAYAIHADIYDSCLAYYFRNEVEKKSDLISPLFMSMVERGRMVTADQYARALQHQATLSTALEKFFDEYDILLTLSSNGEAPKGEEPRDQADTCLVWTLCGVPAVSIPVFTGPRRLPFGAQLVARRYNDLTLLAFARYLELRGLAGRARIVPESL